MGKFLTVILVVYFFTSCAFDGPSHPDIPVLDNIVLESGPGANGKYALAKRQAMETGFSYSPLTEDDSLLKIIVKDKVIFVETIKWDKKTRFYRFEINNDNFTEDVIQHKDFIHETSKCLNCKEIVVPKDERP